MGEVYRARDTRLNRDVAIKVLPGSLAADPDRVRRFEHEARAIGALNHPHICQLYDVGPGYLVLEYIDGKPLRGPLSVERTMGLALQIAGALDAAHRRGILHRDLKPANILVISSSGGSSDPPTVKVLDFGLAKLMSTSGDSADDVTQTTVGMVAGTAAYMSPEQAEGRPLDARSDEFSFGAVLYEMLSGTRAFAGDTTAQVLSAVLRDDPRPLHVAPAFERIVLRCLAKNPNERYASMAEVRAALERVASTVAAPQASIAVLPFANLSADRENEYFGDGLAEEIINVLTRIPDLKVIARTSAFAFKDKHEDVRRIAEALGVTSVLEGSVRKAGSRIRVTAQLITAADGSHLWSERYDRELADVFAVQDEIAEAIARALEVKLAVKPTVKSYKPKLPAYEAFLRGRHHLFKFTPDSFTRARACFEQAIALDPAYAKPHAELGLGHLLSFTNSVEAGKDMVPLIRTEARRALQLDPSNPDPNFLLGAVASTYDYDWKGAAELFRSALAGSAVSSDARWAYASFYLQPLGRFQEAVAEMNRAVEDDPLNVSWRAILSSHLIHGEWYDEAIDNARKALEIDDRHWVTLVILGEAYAYTGRFKEAIEVAEKAYREAPWHTMPAGLLAGALALVGDKERAEQIVRRMGEEPYPVWGRVLYHLLCSEVDDAADWYERMIERRDPFAVIFAAAPLVKRLRDNPRWLKLATMMNLPPA
jgi:serine/threonine-protein kinase